MSIRPKASRKGSIPSRPSRYVVVFAEGRDIGTSCFPSMGKAAGFVEFLGRPEYAATHTVLGIIRA